MGIAPRAVCETRWDMDYSQAKGLQLLLFFGAALGFGVWQLIKIRREIRKDADRKGSADEHEEGANKGL